MTDLQLASHYLPALYADKNEPFPIELIGFSVLRKSGTSPSFRRELRLSLGTTFVIEYAIYFDYDSTHMYDLEHVWVYIGPNGEILNAEASYHGKVMNCFRLCEEIENGSHLRLYMQPGKHAILPQSSLFALYPDYLDCCILGAGEEGLLVPALLEGRIVKRENIDALVYEDMQKRFVFVPTMEFVPASFSGGLVDMDTLLEEIPPRIMAMQEALCEKSLLMAKSRE